MNYLELIIQTTSAGIDQVANALTAKGFDSLVLEDQAQTETFLEENREYWDYIDEDFQQALQGLSRIKLYLECDGTQDAQVAAVETLLGKLKSVSSKNLGELTLTVQPMAETDWEHSWQDNYPPQPVGQNLIVLPIWNAGDTQGRIPVVLDPGLTFGTGAHPSTQMCMTFLEQQVQPGCRVIDLGSGSGILSITALMLGAGSAVGVDIDPKAEDIARENASYNAFEPEKFTARTGNVTEDVALMHSLQAEPYDLVLVNIVADVIIALSPVLAGFLKEDGRLICSGILDVRLDQVKKALESQGLEILEIRAQEDWRSILARRARV